MKNLLLAFLLSGFAPAPAARLDADHQPFARDFRAAEGRVRLVVVLSPT